MRRPWITPLIVTVAIAAVVRLLRLDTPSVAVGSDSAIGAMRLVVVVLSLVIVAATVCAAWLMTRDRRTTALAGLLCALDGLMIVTGRLAPRETVASLAVVVAVVALAVLWSEQNGEWLLPPRRASVVALFAAGVATGARWSMVAFSLVCVAATVLADRRNRSEGTIGVAVRASAVVIAGVLAGSVVVFALLAPGQCRFPWCTSDSNISQVQTASGWTWILQSSPSTIFEEPCDTERARSDDRCPGRTEGSARIVAIGNQVVWLSGTVALMFVAMKRRSEPLTIVVLALAAALWVPWLLPYVTTPSTTGTPLVPVLIIALAMTLARSRLRLGNSVAIGFLASAWFVVNFTKLIGIA